MNSKVFAIKLNELIKEIKQEGIKREVLDFLSKCERAYSSKAHLWNNYQDLELVKKLSPPSKKVLDFGCGIGIQSFLLSDAGYKVIGLETVLDKSLEGFLKAKARPHIQTRDKSMSRVWQLIKRKAPEIEFKIYDGSHIPYNNNTFDVVFSYAVLEHIPKNEVPSILIEIWRILKPGGLFYIFQLPQIYSYTEFLARVLNIEAHEFLWSFPEINKMLSTAGFIPIHHERVDMFFNHPYRLINPVFSVVKQMNKFLLCTPLSCFCHHLTVVAKKKN